MARRPLLIFNHRLQIARKLAEFFISTREEYASRARLRVTQSDKRRVSLNIKAKRVRLKSKIAAGGNKCKRLAYRFKLNDFRKIITLTRRHASTSEYITILRSGERKNYPKGDLIFFIHLSISTTFPRTWINSRISIQVGRVQCLKIVSYKQTLRRGNCQRIDISKRSRRTDHRGTGRY